MAEASITLTVGESWDDGKRIHVIGSLAIDAASDMYATGGLSVPVPQVPAVNAAAKPVEFAAEGLAGYTFSYKHATDRLMVFVLKASAALNDPMPELTAVAIPAGLSGDTIHFHGIYHKFSE